jgi:two-component system, chemotaxis family, protein-glutamate methylesterase/glutaminase
MAGHDIVVIGASAGGVEAIREVVRRIPGDIEAALFFVAHIPPDGWSNLPEILSRSGPLPAVHPNDGQPIAKRTIHVAPPDHHLLLEEGTVRLSRGPLHNRHRPAVDPLFSTAALAYGPRVVGVVLSGALDDGSAGLLDIKRRGGIAVVQDPDTALHPGMPRSALAQVDVEYRLPVAEIGPALARLAREPAGAAPPPDPRLDEDWKRYLGETTTVSRSETPSVYACPECHGTLWESDDGVLRFRCRVGHSFSSESLLAQHDDSLDASLWAALRSLEENAALRRRLAERMMRGERHELAQRYRAKAEECAGHAEQLRRLLTSEPPAGHSAQAISGDDR